MNNNDILQSGKRGRPSRSEIWQYFEYNDVENFSKCIVVIGLNDDGSERQCGVMIRSGKATTNVENHLRRYHPDLFAIAEDVKRARFFENADFANYLTTLPVGAISDDNQVDSGVDHYDGSLESAIANNDFNGYTSRPSIKQEDDSSGSPSVGYIEVDPNTVGEDTDRLDPSKLIEHYHSLAAARRAQNQSSVNKLLPGRRRLFSKGKSGNKTGKECGGPPGSRDASSASCSNEFAMLLEAFQRSEQRLLDFEERRWQEEKEIEQERMILERAESQRREKLLESLLQQIQFAKQL